MQNELSSRTRDRHVLVTGGSKGLGLRIVLELNRKGIPCVIFCRHPITNVTRELLSSNSDVKNYEIHGDVAKSADVKNLFFELQETCINIQGAVHCAAALGEIESIENLSIQKWNETIEANLNGTFYILKECVNIFKRNKQGNFVALSGGGAADPRPKILSYAASKTAIVRLIESVALDNINTGLTFNCVAPGMLPTEMNQQALEMGEGILNDEYLNRIKDTFMGDTEKTFSKPVQLIIELVLGLMPSVTGKLISANWDNWEDRKLTGLEDSTYTLRRIVPKEDEN